MTNPWELRSGNGGVVRPGHEKKNAAQTILRKANAVLLAGEKLVESPISPKTPAEQRLRAATSKLRLFMQGLGLVSALGIGGTAAYEGVKRVGRAAQEQTVAASHTLRSTLNPSLSDDSSSSEAQPATEEGFVNATSSVSWPEDPPSLPDATSSEDMDATLHSDEASRSRRQEIITESAHLLADEFQAQNVFDRVHTPTEFQMALEEHLRNMGITDPGEVETARLTIAQRYRERIEETANINIEEALGMADKMNALLGNVDAYQLALRHHRPDLAAERTSRSLANYSRHTREIRHDSTYADDEDGRRSELASLQRDLIRNIFPAQESGPAQEALRHLNREDRRQLAQALDDQIRELSQGVSEGATNLQEELGRLQAYRSLL